MSKISWEEIEKPFSRHIQSPLNTVERVYQLYDDIYCVHGMTEMYDENVRWTPKMDHNMYISK